MALMSSDVFNNMSLDFGQRKEISMALECSDKNGLVIQGNGQLYKFAKGDAIPERIFINDFPQDSGKEFVDALIKAGRIKVKEKESKKEEAKK